MSTIEKPLTCCCRRPFPLRQVMMSSPEMLEAWRTKGFELTLNTENISNSDFTWTTSFNFALNRNKILKLANPAPIFGVGNPNFTNQTGVIMEGQPVGSFWGLVRLGTWGTDETAEAAIVRIKYISRNRQTIVTRRCKVP